MNYGMLSVDLAFKDFCDKSLDSAVEVTHFNIEEKITIDCGRDRKIEYHILIDPEKQLSIFDAIVIWGDFTTSFVYKEDVKKHLVSKLGLSQRDAVDRYYNTLLLDGCSKDFLQKVLIVSSNILPNSEKKMDQRYKDSASRLYSYAAAIIPRDPMSTAMAQLLRCSSKAVTCGIDAAFFLDSRLSKKIVKKDQIGYSFGRTISPKKGLIRRFTIQRFINSISSITGIKLQNISWKSSDGDPFLFHEKLDELRCCRFIITDTYHCAINSIREGVPVICIGDGSSHQSTTLDDKKKEYMFHSFMGQNYYTFIDNFRMIFDSKRIVRDIADMALDESLFKYFCNNIEIAKCNQIADFQSAIAKIRE